MARDHYIAETYLKHFVGNDRLLHVYRKSDGKYFPSRPRDICHEWDGDIISDFLSTPTLLGDYRKIFEPAWNPALEELKTGKISAAEKLAIAGYWANLLVCTPAWRRVAIESHNHSALDFLQAHDALNTEHGEPDPKLKEALAALEAGNYRLDTEPDFIRAMHAKNLMRYAWALYNSSWIIIKSGTGIAFVTSDNPAAFDDPGPWQGQKPSLPRYLPVDPTLCLFCNMSLTAPRDREPDFTRPPLGQIRVGTIPPHGVRKINRAVIQCAEDLVISREKLESIEALTRKYSAYRVDTDIIRLHRQGEFIFGMQTRVKKHGKEPKT